MRMTEQQVTAEMLALVNRGEPFRTKDLNEIAIRAGLTSRVYSLTNKLTQRWKQEGRIKVIRTEGSRHVWQLARAIPAPEPAPIIPAIQAPNVSGPIDPPAATEGPNNGLTELVAEWLWALLGEGNRLVTLEEGASVAEAHGWRCIARDLIAMLLAKGLRAPGEDCGPMAWSAVWHYEMGAWEVLDEKGGCVCSLVDGDDVPFILAAPRMAKAIQAVLTRFDERGAIGRSDIAALREAIAGVPLIKPEGTTQ